jgi:DUF917 family protein
MSALVFQTLAGVPGSSITVTSTTYSPVLTLDGDSRLLPEALTTTVALAWVPTDPEVLLDLCCLLLTYPHGRS